MAKSLGAVGGVCCSYDPTQNEFVLEQGTVHPEVAEYGLEILLSKDSFTDESDFLSRHTSWEKNPYERLNKDICTEMLAAQPNAARLVSKRAPDVCDPSVLNRRGDLVDF